MPKTCPYLPEPEPEMSHRCLTKLRGGDLEAFYLTALRYGHYLWLQGHASRAILAITRALYTDLDQSAAVLKQWPLPYAALKWIVANHSSDDFPGNPRISFQHQATRLRGHREDLRRARAWAVWTLICDARPSLPADTKQDVQEPNVAEVEQGLKSHGLMKEAMAWKAVLNETM